MNSSGGTTAPRNTTLKPASSRAMRRMELPTMWASWPMVPRTTVGFLFASIVASIGSRPTPGRQSVGPFRHFVDHGARRPGRLAHDPFHVGLGALARLALRDR